MKNGRPHPDSFGTSPNESLNLAFDRFIKARFTGDDRALHLGHFVIEWAAGEVGNRVCRFECALKTRSLFSIIHPVNDLRRGKVS